MTTNTVGSAESGGGRKPLPFSQLWQVPMFLLGLLGLGIVSTVSPLTTQAELDTFDRDLLSIRKSLSQRGEVHGELVALAENVAARVSRQPDRAGEAHFLLGAVYIRKAEQAPRNTKTDDEREKAGLHLELAVLRGVPATDTARLNYLRGKLAYLGKNMPRAIEYLTQSLPSGADDTCAGYAMLVQAHLSGVAPDVEAALAANLKQMEACDDESALMKARMLRGDLLMKCDRRVEAIKWLDSISAKAPLDIRLKARLYQARAAMDEGMWSQAAIWWQELLQHPDAVPGGKGRALYYLGLCWFNCDPPAHADEAAAAWQEAKAYGGDEAQAAALRMGELKLRSDTNLQSALPHFKEALEKVASSAEYSNKLIDLYQARGLLEQACQIYHSRHENDNFLHAAELYKKLAPRGAAEELIGHAAHATGQELWRKATVAGAQKGIYEVQARDSFHKAALAYEQAAEAREPHERIDVLWRSVDCYRLANKPVDAVAALKRFVELPTDKDRKAEAWFTLAEIQKGQSQNADAKESFKHCVAFDNDTFTSRALLQLADLALVEHNLSEAEAVLRQIISPGGRPIGDRSSHETAMLKFANLQFQQRRFEKAALQYKELIQEYPANSNIASLRDRLGQCYLMIANQEGANAEEHVSIAHKRQFHLAREQEQRELALATFQQNADALDAKALALKSEGNTLSAAEESLRRLAHLTVANCYFDQKGPGQERFKLKEAFERYNMVFEQFRHTPEGFEAGTRLASCAGAAANPPHHPDLRVIVYAAEAAIEHCIRDFLSYDQVGTFPTVEIKIRWQDWLNRARIDLRELRTQIDRGKGY